MRYGRLAAAAGVALAGAAGCASERPREAGVVFDTLPGGAVVVRNPAEGAWEEGEGWRIVEELRLGSVESEGAELFSQVAGLVVDDHDRIHVLDREAKEVRIFDAEGGHVRTYARSGSGPGELADPIGLASRADEIWVADPGNARYAVFDTAGSYRTSVPRRLGGYSLPWRGGFAEDGRFWEVSVVFGEDGPRQTILRFDVEMSPRDTLFLPEIEQESFTFEREGSRTSAGVPFTPGIVFDIGPDGRLWLGHNAGYRIAKATLEGDTLLVVEREHDPVPVTEEDRRKAIEGLKGFTSQGGRVDASRIPDTKPAFVRLAADPQGRLWVEPERPDEAAGTRFDVFDAEGRYLGWIDSPVLFLPSPLFREDRIYGTDQDSLGVTYVVRARIERGNGAR